MAVIIPGTCGACVEYRDGKCGRAGSRFFGHVLWALACVGCSGYRRSTLAATGIDPAALAAVMQLRASSMP